MLGSSLFGVMQGRLLPKYKGRYQAHPLGYWQEEFFIAAKFGLDIIEFILDYEDAEKNPILFDPDSICKIIEKTGVKVKSVCADYFMEAPVYSNPDSSAILERLIRNASIVGIRDIVIPCVDKSSLHGRKEAASFIENLLAVIPLAEKTEVNLALETDLPPDDFAWLLSQFNSKVVTVNYDTGNSASSGYNLIEEFEAYGDRITDIHIKDRICGGGSVLLGTGNTDFDALFLFLSKNKFSGPLIMQAYRDDEGIEIFKQQQKWIQDRYNRFIERIK